MLLLTGYHTVVKIHNMQLEGPSIPPLFHKQQFHWHMSKAVVKVIQGELTTHTAI
jgi:hypothetical protein